ncbi:hypothetical protein D3C86_1421590 [compost metagenome]
MESMKEGKYSVDTRRCVSGSLASWVAWGKLKHFIFIGDVMGILIKKLESSDRAEIDYVLSFFWDDINDFTTS